MTQRVGLFFFWIWLKRLEPSFEYDSKKWAFFSESDSKNWTFFSNVTQRIEPLFEYDSENLNFCQINTTQSQRIELSFFFSIRLNELNTFFLHVIHVFKWFKDFFWKNFSKNWIFIWLKEWYLTQRLETYVFGIWFKELDLFLWLADLKFFFFKNYDAKIFFEKYDSKNWTFFCFEKMTQRIEPFFFWFSVKNWAFFSF